MMSTALFLLICTSAVAADDTRTPQDHERLTARPQPGDQPEVSISVVAPDEHGARKMTPRSGRPTHDAVVAAPDDGKGATAGGGGGELAPMPRYTELILQNPNDLLKMGIAFAREKRYSEAAEAFLAASHIAPFAFDTHYLLGMALGKLATEESAPLNTDSGTRSASSHHRGLRDDVAGVNATMARAIAAFRRVVAIKPNHAKGQRSCGALLATLGRHGEACDAFRRASALLPHKVPPASECADACAAGGRMSEAADAFALVHALRPGDEDALYKMRQARELAVEWPARAVISGGQWHAQRGELRQALGRFREAVAAAPRAARPHFLFAFAIGEAAKAASPEGRAEIAAAKAEAAAALAAARSRAAAAKAANEAARVGAAWADGYPIVRDKGSDKGADDEETLEDDDDDEADAAAAAAAAEAAFPIPEVEDMDEEERDALMIGHFWKAAVFEPTFIDALRAVGALLIKVGDRQKQQEDREAAREAAGEVVAAARSDHWRHWPFEEAIVAARSAVAVEPNQPALNRELGAALEAAVVSTAVKSVEGESFLVLGGGGGRVSGGLSRARLNKARRAYIESLRADPRDDRCRRGIKRIEGLLHGAAEALEAELKAAERRKEDEEAELAARAAAAADAAAVPPRYGHAEL